MYQAFVRTGSGGRSANPCRLGMSCTAVPLTCSELVTCCTAHMCRLTCRCVLQDEHACWSGFSREKMIDDLASLNAAVEAERAAKRSDAAISKGAVSVASACGQ
jgi:hypothetical protein